MLNPAQIKVLAEMGKMRVRLCDDIPISISNVADRKIKIPYEEFKAAMGLDSIRLGWLLGRHNFIAGGSVLNWIWGENKNQDIDFFFSDKEKCENFITFIESIGFVEANETSYAKTFFEQETGIILQVIGGVVEVSNNFVAYGHVEDILHNFDFHICKFAVDSDYVYTTSWAIQDLIKMEIRITGSGNKRNDWVMGRILKYNQKGFYISSEVKHKMVIDADKLGEYTNKTIYGQW